MKRTKTQVDTCAKFETLTYDVLMMILNNLDESELISLFCASNIQTQSNIKAFLEHKMKNGYIVVPTATLFGMIPSSCLAVFKPFVVGYKPMVLHLNEQNTVVRGLSHFWRPMNKLPVINSCGEISIVRRGELLTTFKLDVNNIPDPERATKRIRRGLFIPLGHFRPRVGLYTDQDNALYWKSTQSRFDITIHNDTSRRENILIVSNVVREVNVVATVIDQMLVNILFKKPTSQFIDRKTSYFEPGNVCTSVICYKRFKCLEGTAKSGCVFIYDFVYGTCEVFVNDLPPVPKARWRLWNTCDWDEWVKQPGNAYWAPFKKNYNPEKFQTFIRKLSTNFNGK